MIGCPSPPWPIVIAPDVSEIVLQPSVALKSIVSPLIADATASRSEPAPESSQFETVIVEAIAGGMARTAARQSASELRRNGMPALARGRAVVMGIPVRRGGA